MNAPSHPPILVDRRSRRDAGRALRRTVPRRSHAVWQPAPGRDPLGILEAQARTRIPELIPVRNERMRASPLAFLRGAAAIMAADLAGTPSIGLRAQSGGDCHLANFGSYATAEGRLVFDINDFDETLPAPVEWDIKRLATSLVLAAREQHLPPRAARRQAIRAVRAYAGEIGRLSRLSPLEAWSTRIDLLDAIGAVADAHARARIRAGLHDRLRIAASHYGLIEMEGGRPRLREHPPLAVRLPAHEDATRSAFDRYLLALPAEKRVLLDRYRLTDVLFKVVGVGSVGTFCAVGLFVSADDEPLLLQIKQAQASVLEAHLGPSAFGNHGERVVTGQRIMQAASDLFLGWTAAGGRDFYVRQLKDNRLAAPAVDFATEDLSAYGALCGRTLARAHARSADPATLAGYLGRGRAFAHAVGEFAIAYADRTAQDWRAFTSG